MQCFQCGNQFPDGMPACPNCGAPASGQPGGGQPYGYQRQLSKKEFLHHPNLKKCYGNIKSSAIILYICGALSLILGVVTGNYNVILDVVLVVGLGLGIQLAQSRVCAILIFIYSFANAIYMQVTTGYTGGILIIIAAVYAISATFKFQKSWKEYQNTGILPVAK